ncbi:MAG: sugar transferase [Planctomycetota bacterium]
MPGVLSASELEMAFRQERARVDRNGRCFSVVVCAIDARSTDELITVTKVLAERMRSYDSIGNLDNERVALLLPETDGRGAWIFADDALEQLGERGHRANCEVFTYPRERGGREGHGVQRGPHRSSPGDSSGDAEGPSGASDDLGDPETQGHSAHGAKVDRRGDVAASDTPLGRRGTGTDGPAPERDAFAQPSGAKERLATLAPVGERDTLRLAELRRDAASRPVQDLYPLFLEELPLWRRVIDICVATLLLMLLLPFFCVVALCVKLDSPGPVLFVQWRAGRGGRPFRFYKFRSMYIDAEQRKGELTEQNEQVGPIFKIRQDPRITRIGRWIRKASIDEMPQLWNVLIGDMTLVGPRPPTLDEVAAYEAWQRERLDITGGLTCIWQVSGRSEIGFEEWVRMDLEYKRHRSPLFDVKLLWRTIGAVFTGRGAY